MTIPQNLALLAVNQTYGLFKDFADNAASGNPTYIRDGNPVSIVGQLNLATARQMCRRWARQVGSVDPGANEGYAGMCRPYLESINEWPGAATVSPAIPGGQCATSYVVRIPGTFVRRKCSGGAENGRTTVTGNDNSVTIPGPITSIDRITTLTGPCGPRNFVWRVCNVYGTCLNTSIQTAGAAIDERLEFIGGPQISRQDGQPDTCPTGPVIYTPPTPIAPTLPPQRFNPSSNVYVEIDASINAFGVAFINIGGVNFQIDPFGKSKPPLAPPEGGGSADPGDRGEPGSPVDIDADDAQGEAPAGQVLTGVKVEVLSAEGFVNKTETSWGLVYRGACYVFLGGEPGLDLQPEGSTLVSGQFFEAPENSTKWRVCANVGYNLRVTPYYREV